MSRYKDPDYQKKYHKKNGYKSQREYYKRNRKAIIEKQKKYRNKKVDWDSVHLSQIKSKCKKYSLDFDLDIKWLKERIKNGCELTGVSFQRKSNAKMLSPSVDRIDSNKGYTIDNCRVILNCLNTIKSNLDEEEFRKNFAIICENYLKFL